MPDAMRGQGQPVYPLTPYQLSYSPSSQGIARGDGADWFGPLNPLAPIAPPEVAGRRFDFPPGYNLLTRPRAYEPVGFGELRAFADAYDLLRLVIQTRLDQVQALQWSINPRDPRYKRKNAKIAPEMQARINTITAFLRKPDRVTPWRTWVRALVEDMLVIDAPTLYCQRSRSGALYALPYLDGATIKPVIDDWGRTPQPSRGPDGKMLYPPAYQQILKGFPAVNYSTRDIIYRPRNVRTHKVYGYSPVQQVLMTAQIGLRREVWQLDYYTEGSIPDAFMGVPDTWTPDQIRQYQEYLDTLLSGDLARRRKIKIVPGVKAQVTQTKEPEQKGDFDEWLARIICKAFSVSPQWASKMVGRAEAQQHSENSEQEGLEPTKAWIKEWHDGIIEDEFDSSDLEFAWIGQDETDPEKQETILEGRVKVAAITLNEFRDNLGLDPYDDPAADQPMVYTTNGYVPIDTNTIEGKQANLDAFGPPPAAPNATGVEGEDGGDDKDGNPPPPQAKLNGHLHFGKARVRRLAPVPFDRAAAQAAVDAVRNRIATAFGKIGPKAIKAIRNDLGKLAKEKKPKAKAAAITADLDFSALVEITDELAGDLETLSEDSGQVALAMLGVEDRSELVNQVNTLAAKLAKAQAAAMVSGIDDRTRSMLADLISTGLEDNIGTDAIAGTIEDSGLFSSDRADLIARTEVSRANSQAALSGYKTARDEAGITLKKSWLLGANPCIICQDNADDGDIELDDEFSSGDDAPPAHPNCECALSPVVES